MTRNSLILIATAALLVAPVNQARAGDPTPDPPQQNAEALPAVLGSVATGNDNVGRPIAEGPFVVTIPRLASGLEIHAGFLLLQPGSDDLGWAVLTNYQNLASPRPVASPFWTIQTLKPDYEPAFEVGGRYVFADSGNDLQVNWLRFRSTTSSSVQAQGPPATDGGSTAFAGPVQWVSPFSQTGPSSAESFDTITKSQGVNKLRSAFGQVAFSSDVVNLDVGQYVTFGPAIQVRAFGGVSYARLQQRILSSFFGAPPGPDAVFPASVPLVISLDQKSTFEGAGPRVGFDADYEGPYNFRLTGHCAGALLIGRKRPAEYEFNATSPELAAAGLTTNPEHIGSDPSTQVVYSFDARLGIGYCHRLGSGSRFTVEAGYLAAVYIDPFSSYQSNHNILPLQIGSLSTASMRQTLSDFALNGFYLTVGYQW